MNMKLLTAALLFAATLLNSGVARADWVEVATSSDTQLLIDDSAIERRGGMVFYWEKIVFAVPQAGSIKSITSYNSVNCGSRVTRTYELIAYNAAGKAVLDDALGEQNFLIEEIVPGTQGETVYKTVCSNWQLTRGEE